MSEDPLSSGRDNPANPQGKLEHSSDALERARRFKAIVWAFWNRSGPGGITKTTAEQRAIEDILRELGQNITPRQFRRDLARVRVQGGGLDEQRDSLEAYLIPGRTKTSITPAQVSPQAEPFELDALAEIPKGFTNSSVPTETERAWLWHRAFELYESGPDQRDRKSAFIQFLSKNCGCLASSPKTLRELWRRYRARWTNGGKKPGCILALGRPSKLCPIPKEDEVKLVDIIVSECEGRMQQGWRIAFSRRALSSEMLDRFKESPHKVPKAVARQIKHKLPELCSLRRGRRAFELEGPYSERDWSDCNSGDWYQADDVTLPIYYWDPTSGPNALTRGQCLIMIDLRSRKILDFVLISAKNYNALAVRRLMTKVCFKAGLPAEGFYFENGLWKRAGIVKGVDRSVSGVEIESGFSSLGIRFQHARLPRAKPVERVIGILQDWMGGIPGYVGRNEMVDKHERVQRSKLDVFSGRKPANIEFLDVDTWMQELTRICEAYNDRQQNGGGTQGLSPNQAWLQYRSTSAKQADASVEMEVRRLLCTHIKPVRINRNGVQFGIGKENFVYRSEAVGLRRNERVLAWVNVESPEFCTVTDMNKRNPVVLERADRLPSRTASRDALARDRASKASIQRPAREYYSKLTCARPQFRTHIPNPEITKDCEAEETQKRAILKNRSAESGRRAKARALASEVLQTGKGDNLIRDLSKNPDRHERFLGVLDSIKDLEAGTTD